MREREEEPRQAVAQVRRRRVVDGFKFRRVNSGGCVEMSGRHNSSKQIGYIATEIEGLRFVSCASCSSSSSSSAISQLALHQDNCMPVSVLP